MNKYSVIILSGVMLSMGFSWNTLYAAEKNITGDTSSIITGEPVTQIPGNKESVTKGNDVQLPRGKEVIPITKPEIAAPSDEKLPQLPESTRSGLEAGGKTSIDPGMGTTPGAGGGFGAPPRGAADQIRDAAAVRTMGPRITGFSGYSTCVDSRSSATNILRIRGNRFGSTQDSRQIVIVLPIRHTVVDQGYVSVWSDNEIIVQLPFPHGETYQPAHAYQVVIRDSHGSIVSNYSDTFEVCRTEHRISGDITLDNCNAGVSQLTIIAEGTEPGRRYSVQPVVSTHSDFGFSYEFDDLPAGDYTISAEMRADSCSGGSWQPPEQRVSLGHRSGSAIANFRFSVGMVVTPVSNDIVKGLLNDMLRGTWIHINNYPVDMSLSDDARPVIRAILAANQDSVIRLPEDAGGYTQRFDMPVFHQDPFTYYANNINIDSLNVTQDPDGLKIRIDFETGGVELIKECHDNVLCGLAGDIELDLSIDVYFKLVRYVPSGLGVPGISIGDIRVVATPNAQMSGFLCRGADLCDAITNYKREMKQGIENALRTILDSRRVKGSIYTALRPTLDAFHIGNVESVAFDGRNFDIRHTPSR